MNKDIKYLKLCVEGAKIFSTCDKRQYFAVIVDRQGFIIGLGYNGGPKGMPHCSEGACPRAIDKDNSANYDSCIAIHAEANAILHSSYEARKDGGTLYVNGVPCMSCAKLISNSGIRKVVYLEEPSSVRSLSNVELFFGMANITSVGYPASLLGEI
jgi:dCMP deaminase